MMNDGESSSANRENESAKKSLLPDLDVHSERAGNLNFVASGLVQKTGEDRKPLLDAERSQILRLLLSKIFSTDEDGGIKLDISAAEFEAVTKALEQISTTEVTAINLSTQTINRFQKKLNELGGGDDELRSKLEVHKQSLIEQIPNATVTHRVIKNFLSLVERSQVMANLSKLLESSQSTLKAELLSIQSSVEDFDWMSMDKDNLDGLLALSDKLMTIENLVRAENSGTFASLRDAVRKFLEHDPDMPNLHLERLKPAIEQVIVQLLGMLSNFEDRSRVVSNRLTIMEINVESINKIASEFSTPE